MKNNLKIASFGEIMWDIYKDEKLLGGAPLNFSAHLKKAGVNAYMISALGNDSLGDEALTRTKSFGVNCDYIVRNNKITGQCVVKFDSNNEPFYEILDDTSYDRISFDFDSGIDSFDAIAFGSLALRHQYTKSTFTAIKKHYNGAKFFCDINLRPPYYNPETIDFCLKNANIVKVSEAEMQYLQDEVLNVGSTLEAIKKLSDEYKNIEQLILTCGENGAYAYCLKEEKVYYEPAKKVTVVSTVGAGDCFGANYLVNYLKGKSVQTCLKIAAEKSAYVVSKKETVPD